ncbi:MAG: ParB/RepB/Spo0J family partition protein [Desulfovibrio sp.]|jgi:ParB family chromosome partitioning protein|nr:ParB/RepB/Spo0J family partition protein [Desulfovibrio sp.]
MCAMNTKSLGRGLDALFQHDQAMVNDKADMRHVPVTALKPNPGQPRQNFDPTAHRELAESIKAQGIIQPLLVRPAGENTWEIVAGERRWRAAREAGLKDVPVYVRNLTDQEIMVAALTENLQREDLNPVEEAQALEKLQEMLHLTQEALANRLGKSRTAITNALRLLKLSPEATADLRDGVISPGHARCLLGIHDPAAAAALHLRMREGELSVRETEEAAAAWRSSGKFPWTDFAATSDATRQKKGKGKKSAEMRSLQHSLCASLSCKASINGDEHRGRITLRYESNEGLLVLLNRLGVAR